MTPYAEFDRSDYPLINITFTGEKPTDENFQAYLEGSYQNYEHREPIALVFDATNAAIPGLRYQKQQADWMREHDELIRTYCLGIAYVVPNPLIRQVMRAIFKLQQNATAFKVFAEREAGVAWAQERLG